MTYFRRSRHAMMQVALGLVLHLQPAVDVFNELFDGG